MSASLTWYKHWGTTTGMSSASFTSETSIGERDENLDADDMSIGVPDTGYEYSYELWTRAKLSNAPDNLVSNLRMWVDLSEIATGVTFFIGSANSYFTPSGSESTIATDDITDYTGIADSFVIAGTASQIDDYLNFAVFQAKVSSVADYQEQETPVVVHYAYDEE